MRAEQSVRAAVEVFEPLSAPLLQLTQGLKRTFDPFNALNAGLCMQQYKRAYALVAAL